MTTGSRARCRGARERTYVSVALQRIDAACREAAGLSGGARIGTEGAEIPLGEFADELARLMPGFEGPGARTAPGRPPGVAAAPGTRRDRGANRAPRGALGRGGPTAGARSLRACSRQRWPTARSRGSRSESS